MSGSGKKTYPYGYAIIYHLNPHTKNLILIFAEVRTRAVDPDPNPGGKIFQIKTEKGKEIADNCNFIPFLM